MGTQCCKTPNDSKSTGLMTVQGIWIMERVDQKANQTAGWMTSHATPSKRTPFSEQWRGWTRRQVHERCGIMCTMCNKELWMVESLATPGLYCMLFLLTNDVIVLKSQLNTIILFKL